MSEPGNANAAPNAARPQRKKLGLLYWIGMLLLILGSTFAANKTVQHLKQEPREPLGFDLTLQWGDGGFIAYGVATAIIGLILVLIGVRGRKDAEPIAEDVTLNVKPRLP